MEHIKIEVVRTIERNGHTLIIEGPIPPERLKTYTLHDTLDAFRRPPLQHKALVNIAGLPEGRIIAAREGDLIVGYVTFHYPDEMERWSQGGMEELIELGAIEVADGYRGLGIGKAMLEVAFAHGQLDHMIVFTTEYYWHWDLDGLGMDVWEYRNMMERLMKSVGMVCFTTDDPEIRAHPANCLMARIGSKVPQEAIEKFDQIRLRRLWQ